RRKCFDGSVGALNRNSIRQRVFSAVQSPGSANRTLHMRMDGRGAPHAHFIGNAKATAEFARPAGILSQCALLDNNRTFGFGGFYWRIVRIAVIQAYRRAHTVFIMFCAPAATRMTDMRPEKPSGRRVEPVRIHGAQISIMSSNGALGTGRSKCPKNRIAD